MHAISRKFVISPKMKFDHLFTNESGTSCKCSVNKGADNIMGILWTSNIDSLHVPCSLTSILGT